MHWLNIAKIIEATEAEGPGLRFVIWVQGCLKRCKGCCNGDLLQIKPSYILRSSEIIDQLLKAVKKYPLEGITFLGGEPMLQAEGLADVSEAAQLLGLSVICFSGYKKDELIDTHFTGSRRLLAAIDLLIDGEFDQNNIETKRNWVGSTNQQFHYLTNRYNYEIEMKQLVVTNEWRIDLNGKVIGNGLPFRINRNKA